MPRTKRSSTPIEIVYVPASDPRAVGGLTMRQASALMVCMLQNKIPHTARLSLTDR